MATSKTPDITPAKTPAKTPDRKPATPDKGDARPRGNLQPDTFTEEEIDGALEDSFPASDPPPYNAGVIKRRG